MALRKPVNYRGLSTDSAYIRVSTVSISHSAHTLEFWANVMSDQDSLPFDVITMQAPYHIDGENPFVQAYEHLKTLPEFEDATDC